MSNPTDTAAPDVVSATDMYAQRFAGATGAWMLERQTKAILALLAPWSRAEVLDIGGGHAQVAPPLAALGHDVTTLASCAPAARRLLSQTGGQARVVLGDLYASSQPRRSTDLVVAMRMMAHMEDWELFITGACRVAREAVILDFPVAAGINTLTPLFFGAKKRIEKDTRCYRMLSMAAVTRAFEENGFEVDAHVGQFVFPMALHRVLKARRLSAALEGLAAPLAPHLGNPVIVRARRIAC